MAIPLTAGMEALLLKVILPVLVIICTARAFGATNTEQSTSGGYVAS